VPWHSFVRAILLALVVAFAPVLATAATLYVSPGGAGNGSAQSPFGRIADALAQAGPGDEIVLKPGTYAERVQTVRGGTAASRLVIRADVARTAVLTSAAGTVLRVAHPYVSLQGLVVDGQYGAFDTVIVDDNATALLMQDVEVRRASKDCIDIRSPADVVIEGALVHHCLNAANGRTDAHAIVAGAAQNLIVRDSELHTFSGDGIQLDPARATPGWNRLTLERCRIWIGPLETAENGFAAGTVPGENAVDLKTSPAAPRAVLIVRQTEAWGFRGGLINNMAAFNIKENVDVTLDGVTVSRSEIAFRLRGRGPFGGAWVRVQNAVVYDVATAVRYEDNIERVQVWNSTFGSGIQRLFHAAASNAAGVDVQNLLYLGSGSTIPGGTGNMQASPTFFVDAAAHDYRLVAGSPAIDAGASLPGVTGDRGGASRPVREHWDVGAFEFTPSPVPAATTRGR
jgi:hypothetical protein